MERPTLPRFLVKDSVLFAETIKVKYCGEGKYIFRTAYFKAVKW